MKVALVHDYLREYGGAERVVEALHEIFPEAPIYTAYLNLKTLGPSAERVKNWDIHTSWIQNLPLAGKMLSPLRIVAPWAFSKFDLSDFDVVFSSTAIYFSQAVKVGPKTLHLVYMHTSPKYLYGYTTSFNYKKHWWTKVGAEVANHFLRLVDFELNQRPDILIANSKNVAERIKKFYRREAEVIYPPVDVQRFEEADSVAKGEYFLSVSRLWKGKGVDIVVKACSNLDLPLVVVGTGPEEENLKKIAGKTVKFLGAAPDEDLPGLYTSAKAVIVATEDEDFGIVPVEAMASGTPVIAPASGGFLETVVDKKTGLLYGGDRGKATVESLMEAIKCFNDLNHNINEEDLRKQARKFSRERFKKEILHLIEKNIKVGDKDD